MSETFTIPEAPGLEFTFSLLVDDMSEPPWEREDGHGPVRAAWAPCGLRGAGIKRPGERVIHWDGRTGYLYDWQAACKRARTDGWDAEPYGAPNRIERAVRADMDRMRKFLQGLWWYAGIEVKCKQHPELTDSVFGYESDQKRDYETAARELAHEIAHCAGQLLTQRRARWRAALKEARERRYWSRRDVLTLQGA